jgi:hypothetical protein
MQVHTAVFAVVEHKVPRPVTGPGKTRSTPVGDRYEQPLQVG